MPRANDLTGPRSLRRRRSRVYATAYTAYAARGQRWAQALRLIDPTVQDEEMVFLSDAQITLVRSYYNDLIRFAPAIRHTKRFLRNPVPLALP